jgi:hypothetical protein
VDLRTAPAYANDPDAFNKVWREAKAQAAKI